MQDNGNHYAADCQNLGHTHVADHQAVCAETFHHGTFCAVPADIDEEDLSVIAANFLGEKRQQYKAQQAPDGFVQETGVNRLRRIQRRAEVGEIGGGGILVGDPLLDSAAGHSEDAVGVAAERLLVEEVAPASDALSQQESDADNIQQGQELHLAYLCHQSPARKLPMMPP